MTYTTPRGIAANIMDNACLPKSLVDNGVDKALREAIAKAIEEAYGQGYTIGRLDGESELQRSLRNLLGV